MASHHNHCNSIESFRVEMLTSLTSRQSNFARLSSISWDRKLYNKSICNNKYNKVRWKYLKLSGCLSELGVRVKENWEMKWPNKTLSNKVLGIKINLVKYSKISQITWVGQPCSDFTRDEITPNSSNIYEDLCFLSTTPFYCKHLICTLAKCVPKVFHIFTFF